MITFDAPACPLARPRAALRSAKAITSAGCGSSRMSLSAASSASSTSPSRSPTSASTIGALVSACSAATSPAIGESASVTCRTTSALSIGVRLSFFVYVRSTRSRRSESPAGRCATERPLRSTTTRPRLGRAAAPLLVATVDAPLAQSAGEWADLARPQAGAEDGLQCLDAFRAVRRLCHGPEREPQVAVLGGEQKLLCLAVAERERDRLVVGRVAEPPAARGGRAEDEQVPQDHAGCDAADVASGRGVAPGRGPQRVLDVREYVDVIAFLHDPDQELVRVAGDAHRPQRSGD